MTDKTIKLWKISERDKRPEGYNLKEEDGRYKDPNTITSLRVSPWVKHGLRGIWGDGITQPDQGFSTAQNNLYTYITLQHIWYFSYSSERAVLPSLVSVLPWVIDCSDYLPSVLLMVESPWIATVLVDCTLFKVVLCEIWLAVCLDHQIIYSIDSNGCYGQKTRGIDLMVPATELVFVVWLHSVLIEFGLVQMQLITQGSEA